MGLRPQMRSEKCLQGSDPLLPASQQGAAQSPGPALGEPLRWPDQRQGWDSSQPGHVNPVSIYERNDVSVWKVRSKCGRIDTQPKLVRETMNTTISTWMKFFFIWSWHSLLLTPSSTKRQKMTFCFAVETLESTLSEAKELILHYLFFFFRSNFLQIFCLPSCTFQIWLLRELTGPRAECLHENTNSCKLLTIF